MKSIENYFLAIKDQDGKIVANGFDVLNYSADFALESYPLRPDMQASCQFGFMHAFKMINLTSEKNRELEKGPDGETRVADTNVVELKRPASSLN